MQADELVAAMHAVNQRIPEVARALLTGDLPTAKQYEFGALLIELGELLYHYADDQCPDNHQGS